MEREVKCLYPLHPWQHLRTLYGWLGERAREAEGKGRDPEKAQDQIQNDCIYQNGLLSQWLEPNMKFYIWDSLVVRKTKGKLKWNGDTAYIRNAYLSWHRSRTFSHNHSNFFFKWQWSQCIRKQCYHLAASRGTLCTETCTVKDHGLLEDRGRYGLQGFPGYRAVESESSIDLESSSAKDLSLTQEQIKTDCSCSLPQPCWARGPSHMGFQTATKIWPYTESQ